MKKREAENTACIKWLNCCIDTKTREAREFVQRFGRKGTADLTRAYGQQIACYKYAIKCIEQCKALKEQLILEAYSRAQVNEQQADMRDNVARLCNERRELRLYADQQKETFDEVCQTAARAERMRTIAENALLAISAEKCDAECKCMANSRLIHLADNALHNIAALKAEEKAKISDRAIIGLMMLGGCGHE